MMPALSKDLYNQAEAARMSDAFSAAWKCIEASGSELADARNSEETRERLLSAIISLVRRTNADAADLRDASLRALGFVFVDVICAPAPSPN